MNKIKTLTPETFENIRYFDESGNEYWFARELSLLLEYQDWRNFTKVIKRAIQACQESGHSTENHFGELTKMVLLGSASTRSVKDFRLSRYACYLIVQNGDPSKSVIANGQTYFALQTRRQELDDENRFAHLPEDQRRLILRNELIEHNKTLTTAAKEAGVVTNLDYAIFQDHGYKGLYGGRSAKDIHAAKNLKKSQKVLDHMGSTELAANLFRATQTEDKLRREQIQGKQQANQTHFQVGQTVRRTIQELGGTMPEALPIPDKSIQQLARAQKKLEKQK